MGIIYSVYHYVLYCGPPIPEEVRVRVTIKKLNKTQDLLENLIEERQSLVKNCRLEAVELVKTKNLSTAKRKLALIRIYEEQLKKYNEICLNLHKQLNSIIEAETMNTVFETLKIGSETSNNLLSKLDPQKVQELYDTVEEQMQDIGEIGDIFSGELFDGTVQNDEELEEELKKLCNPEPTKVVSLLEDIKVEKAEKKEKKEKPSKTRRTLVAEC